MNHSETIENHRQQLNNLRIITRRIERTVVALENEDQVNGAPQAGEPPGSLDRYGRQNKNW